MTHFAIALYLGESYATACVFDLNSPTETSNRIEKSVYLPQTSLKALLNYFKANLPADSQVKSVFIVTRYMDRLKTFRLGGSVVQVVPEGFENSYSLANTQLQSLAAPALILPLGTTVSTESLTANLVRLKKVNSEINKVVFQLPETHFSNDKIQLIKHFFLENGFKLFSVPNPLDFQSVRRTLLNAGSEGTKEEILSDVTEAFGPEIEILFWINNGFSKEFENIDLYFSSQNFIRSHLQKQKLTQAFYFDLENWNLVTIDQEQKWHSPWGAIDHRHPRTEEFSLSPYCELTVDASGQLVVSGATPQFEPGPIVAGRSVKTLILDVFSDEIKNHKILSTLFPQIATESLQQKINNQFQIMQKAQSLDEVRLTKTEIKNWLRFSVATWILQNQQENPSIVMGDMGSHFYSALNKSKQFVLSDFSWTEQIINQAEGTRN